MKILKSTRAIKAEPRLRAVGKVNTEPTTKQIVRACIAGLEVGVH